MSMAFAALILMVLGLLLIFRWRWLPPRADGSTRILFYDGECGLCTHSVKFFLKADKYKRLNFAPLQGTTAAKHLPQNLRKPQELSTVVYLRMQAENTKPEILIRSTAVAKALMDIGGLWRIAGWIVRAIPLPVRESLYRFIAKHRRKFFPGGACSLPTQKERERLLD